MGRGIVKKEQSLDWDKEIEKPVNKDVTIRPCTFLGIICDRHGGLVNSLKAL